MWEERTLKVDCGSSNVAMDLELGDRVALRSLVGNVRFIGETHFAAGIWIGIELEEPVGKNDGSVDGIRYFLPKNATGKGLFGIFSRRDGIHKVSQGYTPPSTAGGEQRTASNAESRASDPSRLKKIIAKLEDKLYAMNEKCKALEQEVGIRLLENTKLERLETQLEKITLDRDMIEQQNESLMNQLEELTNSQEKLLVELNVYKEEIMLRRKADVAIAEIDLDSVDAGSLVRQNRLMSVALQKLQHDLSLSQEQCNLLRNGNSLLEGEVEEYINETRTLKLRLSEASLSLEELKQQLSAVNNSSTIIESLTTENFELNTQIEQLKQELAKVSRDQAAEEELEKLYKEIEKELTEQISKLQDTILNDESLINSLKIQNAELREKSHQIRSHPVIEEADTSDLKMKLASLSVRNEELKLNYDISVSKLSNFTIDDRASKMSILRVLVDRDCRVEQSPLELCITKLALLYYFWILKTGTKSEVVDETIDIDKAIEKSKNGKALKISYDSIEGIILHSSNPYVVFGPISEFLRNSLELLLRDVKAHGSIDTESVSVIYDSFQKLDNHISAKMQEYQELENSGIIFETSFDTYEIFHSFMMNLVKIYDDGAKILETISEIVSIDVRKITQIESVADIELSEDKKDYDGAMQNLEKIISDKDSVIDELQVQINILRAKFSRNDQHEQTISNLKGELMLMKDKNNDLKKQLSEVAAEYDMFQQKIEVELQNRHNLLSSKSLVDLQKEKVNNEKLDLISEIADLRQILRLQDEKTKLQWSIKPFSEPKCSVTAKHFKDFNNLANILKSSIEMTTISPNERARFSKRHKLALLKENNELSNSFIHSLSFNL